MHRIRYLYSRNSTTSLFIIASMQEHWRSQPKIIFTWCQPSNHASLYNRAFQPGALLAAHKGIWNILEYTCWNIFFFFFFISLQELIHVWWVLTLYVTCSHETWTKSGKNKFSDFQKYALLKTQALKWCITCHIKLLNPFPIKNQYFSWNYLCFLFIC